MSDISKIKINDTTYDIKDPTARTDAASAASAVNNKVSKSGDTMTGALRVEGTIIADDTRYSSADLSSSQVRWFKSIGCDDNRGNYVSYMQPLMYTNGTMVTQFGVRKTLSDGTNLNNVLELCVSSTGTPIVQVTNQPVWLNGLGITWGSGGKTAGTTAMSDGNIYLQYE